MISMNFRQLSIILITGLVVISCNSRDSIRQDHTSMPDMAVCTWIEGEWIQQSEEGMLVEKWDRTNDSSMAGLSFLVNGKDTLFFEKIRLSANKKGIFYLPTVQGQNGNQEISFELVRSTTDTLIFENLKHDFPQRIIYSHPATDSLVASIEGTDKGKLRKEIFRMHKDK